MRKRCPIGIDNFQKLVDPQNDYLFIDRTPLIKQVAEEGAEVIAFHAFRRMGKSLFASMLYHFFSPQVVGQSTEGLFNHLEINQQHPAFVQQHQGQYPVIKMTLKEVQETSFENALRKIANLMKRAYQEHEYLLSSPLISDNDKATFSLFYAENQYPEQDKLEESLFKLTYLLNKHHNKKVWIIIDEYDSPLASAYLGNFYPQLLKFMRNFYSAALKSNDYVEKGILLGILRLTKESILSGMNNPKVYTLLKPGDYQPYFGFTGSEVKHLFTQAGLSHELEPVREWYNGYHIDGQALYNPWSIINCIDNKGELRAYWVNTANDSLLKECLGNASPAIKAQFAQLVLGGKPIRGTLNEYIRFEHLQQDESALWSLLYATGYLTGVSLTLDIDQYHGLLRIPNQEIRGLYISIFGQWLDRVLQGYNRTLLNALVEADIAAFAELIEEYLLEYASIHHLKYEGCYHSLVLGMLYGLGDTHYVFSGTLESGQGFSDLLLIPKEKSRYTQAILVEFKRTKKDDNGQEAAEQALGQIAQLDYLKALQPYPYLSAVVKIGMAFVGKKVFWVSDEVSL